MRRGCRPWSLSEPFPACHSTPRQASSALRMLTGTCVCMLHCRLCASQGLLDLCPGDSLGPKTSPEHWRVLRLIRASEHWALGLSCLSRPGSWKAGCYSLPGLACWPRFFSCLRAGRRQGLRPPPQPRQPPPSVLIECCLLVSCLWLVVGCLSCLVGDNPSKRRTLWKGRPSSLTVSLARPLRFWVVRPASRRSRSWTGHGSFSRGLSSRVGRGTTSPKGAAKKEVHTSIPTSLDKPSNTVNREAHPSHLPRHGERGGTAHRAGGAAFCARISRGQPANQKCAIQAFRSHTQAKTSLHFAFERRLNQPTLCFFLSMILSNSYASEYGAYFAHNRPHPP